VRHDLEEEVFAMELSSRAYGLLAVLTATVALSTAGLMTRLVHVDAPTLTLLRGLFGGLFLFACLLVVFRRRAFGEFVRLGWGGLLISTISAACMILFINALYLTSVAHVSVIFALCPFIAAGLALLILGERPAPSALIASGVALVGIVIMMTGGGEGAFAGDLLAFAMTVLMALWTVLVRRQPDTPALAGTVASTIIAAVMIAPFASPFAASAHDLVVVFLFGVFGFSVGFMLLLIGSRLLPPVESVLIGSLEAPLAPLWVLLFVGEAPDFHAVVGGTIVFGAVCLNVVAGRRSSRQPCVDVGH
jgi:drug/metabolite transporter (DMT)-like permease